MRLFAALASNLADLAVDQLQTELATRLELVTRIQNKDSELAAQYTRAELRDELTAGVEQIETLKDAISDRLQAEQETDDAIAELAASALEGLEIETPETDVEPETPADPAAEAEVETDALAADTTDEPADPAVEDPAAEVETPEPVAAAAAPRLPIRVPLPQPTAEREPREARAGSPFVAAAGVRVVRENGEMNRLQLGEALIEALGNNRGGSGKKHIASVSFGFPEDRILRGDASDAEKILAVIGPNAIGRTPAGLEARVAAGGLCAPLTPLYDIPNFGTAERPVRDSLPTFNAVRGGITHPVPTTLADAMSAITVITEDADAQGGTYATKAILAASCPSFVDVTVTAVAARRSYGNLGSLAWPEQVAHENDVTRDAHARIAESYLLEQMKQLSLENSFSGPYNAVYDLLYALLRSAASMRYLLRMSRDMRLRAWLPEVLIELLLVDLAGAEVNDRFFAQSKIEQILRNVGIEPTWYKDTPLNTGTTYFAAEVDNTTEDAFPTTIEIGLAPEGTFIHLDKGQLDFGIVRDSSLNETNDWETFFETFENVARVGPVQAARWINATLLPRASFPTGATILT